MDALQDRALCLRALDARVYAQRSSLRTRSRHSDTSLRSLFRLAVPHERRNDTRPVLSENKVHYRITST